MRKVLLLLLVSFFYLGHAQQSSDSVVVQSFEVSNLTQATEETDNAIKKIQDKVNGPTNVHSLLNDFEEIKRGSEVMRNDTSEESLNEYNLWALTDLLNKWIRYEKQIEGVKKNMSDLSINYQEALQIADDYSARWQKTKEESKDSELPDVLKERIEEVLTSLNKTSEGIKDSLIVVLEKFDGVSKEYNAILDIKLRIKNLSDSKKLNIFSRDAKPFFKELKEKQDSTTLTDQFVSIWTNTISDTREFLRENKEKTETHLVFFVLSLIFLFWVSYQYKKSDSAKEPASTTADYLIRRPFILALLFNTFAAFWVYTNAPSYIGQLLVLFNLIPIILLLPGILEPRLRKVVYITAVVYLLHQTEEFMPMFPTTQRILILIEATLAALSFIHILRPNGLIYSFKNKVSKILIRVCILFLFLSLASIYGNLSGSLFLAKLLSRTIVISSAVLILLYMTYNIIESLIAFFFQSKSGQSLNLIRLYGDDIKHKIMFYLQLGGFYIWVKSFLNMLGILSFIVDSFNDFLEIGWNFGEVYLSVGQVVNFIIILVVFSIIANLFKGLIQVEILPRFAVAKGIPMAAGLLTRYFILVLGFLMAVSAAGIPLDKLGFIAGALGVGIGFGLQNVVGNFVSGLILIFERPVRVGDIVSASNVEGTITEIGIRASKIRDYDGAEIIVPNSELITLKVTNWTLSDANRRRELLIRVEYGSDPHQVIDIIKYVMSQHPDVKQDPSPNVFFQGYKEFSLDFRVLFWTNENGLKAKSDVNLGIHDELKNVGIKIPIPKRQLIDGKTQRKKPVPKKTTSAKAQEKPKDKEA